ncbi:BamA/TamA family outer membrane protein [Vibrio coralliirubri]|uniref:BamA/TamA family outer membrane protein n=1 Tax=Vibrio coralliirubri TaxID=1516159 RepID=UPI00062F131D|nr:BamA/TamA family outer membrane protein [Vibrio coralliirubri]CDT34396.1 Outer membrane protein/protective antigen OMA87 [Vibrio coralliirubri]CDT85563.1 Outer membrane protein/protective antigen OMA87 [Vibrio coralliirubri]CDT91912.1 Outer membrane protein/protective antigen OMA87 [Vibrio coralliirubri]CDU15469.1 Outer membrane protein/protective antigen OMA87 [Vibrio coralliirubri]
MIKSKLFHSVSLIGALFSSVSYGSFFDAVDDQFDMGHHIAENAVGFLPVPVLITEPAVGYGGGLVGVFMHETDEQKQQRKQAALNAIDGGAQLVPGAITVLGAAGTENGSWVAFVGHRHTWLNDTIRYTGGVGAGQMNLSIYKDLSLELPNNKSTDIQPLEFSTETRGVVLQQGVQFRVADTPLMLGVKQFVSYTEITSDSQIVDKLMEYTLGQTIVTSGLGLTADYDTRNNLFYPTSGYQFSADYMVYDEKLGSDQAYRKLDVEGEVYVPLATQWTLAFAANYQNFQSDELFLSPTTQPYIQLRGVSSYRYQGDEITTLQSQVVFDIDDRWNVSGFYGYGQAKEEVELSQDQTVGAYGVGFRYQIARRYGLRIGMDLARSDDENAFYISLGSGF